MGIRLDEGHHRVKDGDDYTHWQSVGSTRRLPWMQVVGVVYTALPTHIFWV